MDGILQLSNVPPRIINVKIFYLIPQFYNTFPQKIFIKLKA